MNNILKIFMKYFQNSVWVINRQPCVYVKLNSVQNKLKCALTEP